MPVLGSQVTVGTLPSWLQTPGRDAVSIVFKIDGTDPKSNILGRHLTLARFGCTVAREATLPRKLNAVVSMAIGTRLSAVTPVSVDRFRWRECRRAIRVGGSAHLDPVHGEDGIARIHDEGVDPHATRDS